MEEDLCIYCGLEVAEIPCKSCGDEYCAECISPDGHCPNCDEAWKAKRDEDLG